MRREANKSPAGSSALVVLGAQGAFWLAPRSTNMRTQPFGAQSRSDIMDHLFGGPSGKPGQPAWHLPKAARSARARGALDTSSPGPAASSGPGPDANHVG